MNAPPRKEITPKTILKLDSLANKNKVIKMIGKSVMRGARATLSPSLMLYLSVWDMTNARSGPGASPADRPRTMPSTNVSIIRISYGRRLAFRANLHQLLGDFLGNHGSIAQLLITSIEQKAQWITLRACAKISSQNWRSDLVQIWPIRLSKTGGIASYFEEFENEVSVKDGLKLRCQNVKLFLRES